MLRVRNLDVGYGSVTVLRRVSLHVREGEVVAIIGANGAGKTTLLEAITGLVRARGGEIALRGRDVVRLSTEETVALGCSLVPEGRQVFSSLTVKDNLLLGAHVQYRRGRRQEVAEDLERVYHLFPVLAERERHFQIVIGRRRALDEATVLVAVSQAAFFDEMKRQSELRDLLKRRLSSELGVSFEVKLVERHTLEAAADRRKVVDLRKL